jgi:hypothetical protein
MSKKSFIIFFMLFCSLTGNMIAQSSQVLYFMNLPQRNSLNPALQPGGRVYVGLSVISDLSIRIDNNFLNFSDLFRNGVISDSTFTFLQEGEGLNALLAGLQKRNSIEPQVGIQLFGLAFTIGKDLRITFDINERIDGNFTIPKDIIMLGVEGTQSYLGRDIDLSSLRADMLYYHEIGIGASKNVTDKLRVGGRVMILGGVAAGYLENNGLNLKVNEDYTHTVDADLSFNVSAPVTFVKDEADGIIHTVNFNDNRFADANSTISYLGGMGNTGLGIDLGAEYRFNDMLAVSAAITNLGYIKWKRDRSTIKIKKQFEFNGLTLQDVYEGSLSFDELMNWTIDSIQNAIELVDPAAPFTTYLPTSITAAFSITPVKFFTAGIVSQTRFKDKQVHELLTFSGNINIGNTFSTTLAYTIANQRYDNFGFGLAVRGGFTQFFAVVDNIPVRWTHVTSGESSFRIPENWHTLHARIGLNFVFGNREREETLPPM